VCEEFEHEEAMELEFPELEVIDLVRLVLRLEMGLEEGSRRGLNDDGWLYEAATLPLYFWVT
jgi:hypothetical protein